MLDTIREEGVDLWNTTEKFFEYELYREHKQIINDIVERTGEKM